MARSLLVAGIVLGGALLVAPAAHAAGPALTATVVPSSTWNSGYGATSPSRTTVTRPRPAGWSSSICPPAPP
ncbi:hypothetical protein [Actinoplanes sp. NPDC051411]|uniref:hypothetical protein n=1 Tax=Actinoplanes sp. NPDC051411 TaxID=3155522 RepID=UPI0034274E7E